MQEVNAGRGTVTLAVNSDLASSAWPSGPVLQFYITTVRLLAAGPLGPARIQALTAGGAELVAEAAAVPLSAPAAQAPYAASAAPVSTSAGVRTELNVQLTLARQMQCCATAGGTACAVLYAGCASCLAASDRLACRESARLPADALVEVVLPPEFLINDGDSTQARPDPRCDLRVP